MKKKTIFLWVVYTLVLVALISLTKGFTFPSGGDIAQGGFQLICWVVVLSPIVFKVLSPVAMFLAKRGVKRV